MGWLARLFGREQHDPFKWKNADSIQWKPAEQRPIAPKEGVTDPNWAWQTLVAWWERMDGEAPAGGVSDEAIEGLARRYDIVLPPDFHAYLAHACPWREEEMDSGLGLGGILVVSATYPKNMSILSVRS